MDGDRPNCAGRSPYSAIKHVGMGTPSPWYIGHSALVFDTTSPRAAAPRMQGTWAAWPAVACRVHTDRDVAGIASRELHPHRDLRWPPPLRESCGWTGVSVPTRLWQNDPPWAAFRADEWRSHLRAARRQRLLPLSSAPTLADFYGGVTAAGGPRASPGVACPVESLSTKRIGERICAAGYSSRRARSSFDALISL